MITSLDINIVSFLINYCKLHKINNKFTLASCLVYNNKKYGLSINDYNKSNVLTKKYNYQNTHAEIATIFKSTKYLNIKCFKKSTLYVTGVGRSFKCNILKSSKPCLKCQLVINNFNIPRLVYVSSNDNKQLIINEVNE